MFIIACNCKWGSWKKKKATELEEEGEKSLKEKRNEAKQNETYMHIYTHYIDDLRCIKSIASSWFL